MIKPNLDSDVRTFFSNRYADAFAKMILFCGIIHLVILIWQTVQGNPYALNVFNIVGLHLLIPGLEQGLPNFILSYCITVAMYVFIYVYLGKRANKEKP
jgi:hypothetical protein